MAATGPKQRKHKEKHFHLRSWLINQLRGTCRRYPAIYNKRNQSKETYYIPSKSGKQLKRVKFKCNVCKQYFGNSDINIDHIIPVVPETGFPLNPDGSDNWSEYINRLFCSEDNLQVICAFCHKIKSDAEKEARKLQKK